MWARLTALKHTRCLRAQCALKDLAAEKSVQLDDAQKAREGTKQQRGSKGHVLRDCSQGGTGSTCDGRRFEDVTLDVGQRARFLAAIYSATCTAKQVHQEQQRWRG